MSKFLTLLFFFITVAASAQTGINYKALVKDNLDNVVTNQAITVQFSILKGVAQTNVFQQTHTPTTDANGIIIVTIGANNNFDTIDWGSDDHFLNVQIDTGAGLIDMGTTQFMAVPYALNAANVTGLEALDEGNGVGWRIKGQDPANYGTIGEEAVDVSNSSSPSTTIGATGAKAFTAGVNTTASGIFATALGNETKAEAGISTAIGTYNVGGGNPEFFILTDPLFEIGNGLDDASRSNALTVLKNGTVIAPSFDLVEITDDKALITKEYADTNLGSSGLEALDEGNGIGWRLKGKDPDNYGDIGIRAVDLSHQGFASTYGATNNYSFATGLSTIASGEESTAMGWNTRASGDVSTALGFTSTSNGKYSVAAGSGAYASSFSEIALGRFNLVISPISSSSWNANDVILAVGNGIDLGNRSNALTVLKNGTITAPSFDLAEITDDKALITKEYLEINGSSGLESLDEGNGIGWRIKGRNPANYGNIGEDAVDLSTSTVASSIYGATSEKSVALGQRTTSSGYASTALGHFTTASSLQSTAMGDYTISSGIASTAMGRNTEALAHYSTSMGKNTKAEALSSTAIGQYNIGGGNLTSWTETDPIFEVGNGDNSANKDNAITVLKNGKVGIGEHQPDAFLEIKANNNTNEPTIKLIHEGTTGARINFTDTGVTNGNRWTLYGDADDVDANSVFNIYHPNVGNIVRIKGDGDVGIGTVASYRLDVRDSNSGDYAAQVYNTSTNANADGLKIRVGRTTAPTSSNSYMGFFDGNNTSRGRIQGNGTGVTYNTTSDSRLKTNISDITEALTLIDKIQPRQYEYKTYLGLKEYGFIAQELQPFYAQAVTGTPDSDVEKDPMMVDYGRLTPLLTAGIKELNDKVTSQEKDINILKEENLVLKQKLNKLELLEARLAAIETNTATFSVKDVSEARIKD